MCRVATLSTSSKKSEIETPLCLVSKPPELHTHTYIERTFKKLFAVSFYRYFKRKNTGAISFSTCDSPSPVAPPSCEQEDGCEAEVQQKRPTQRLMPPLSNLQKNQEVKHDAADDESSVQAAAAVLGAAVPTETGLTLAWAARKMACSRGPSRAPGERSALGVRGQSHSSHHVQTWAVQEVDTGFQGDIEPV